MVRKFPDLEPSFDIEEAKNVLGYPKTAPLDRKTLELLEEVKSEAKLLLSPKGLFSEVIIEVSDEEVTIESEGRGYLLKSKRLARRLKGAKSAFIFIVTIGHRVDDRIQELIKKEEYTKALFFDAVGSAYAEGLAEKAQQYLSEIAKPFEITYRFSPGYGDLGLEAQKIFFEILKPEQIGVSLTSSFMMKPRKSVTAICGKILTE